MVTEERVRELALALPEAQEGVSYGTPAFYVKKKLFARIREDHTTVVVKIPRELRAVLNEANPRTFTIPDHYLNYDMVVVELAHVKVKELKDLLREAWRFSAPEKLVKAHAT